MATHQGDHCGAHADSFERIQVLCALKAGVTITMNLPEGICRRAAKKGRGVSPRAAVTWTTSGWAASCGSDELFHGRRLTALNLIDKYSRECLEIADREIGGDQKCKCPEFTTTRE